MNEVIKQYFTYDQIHRTVTKLASAIQADGFDSDLIVAIGTVGASFIRTPANAAH